jgi:hypothetical protein
MRTGREDAVLAALPWAAPAYTPAWHSLLPLDAQESLWYLLCVSDGGLLKDENRSRRYA